MIPKTSTPILFHVEEFASWSYLGAVGQVSPTDDLTGGECGFLHVTWGLGMSSIRFMGELLRLK